MHRRLRWRAFVHGPPLCRRRVDAGHFDLGVALQESGKLQLAIEADGKAIALDACMIAAHHNLGSAWQALGKMDEAPRAYARAWTLDPARFPRIAQELAAGATGKVWLTADALRTELAGARQGRR